MFIRKPLASQNTQDPPSSFSPQKRCHRAGKRSAQAMLILGLTWFAGFAAQPMAQEAMQLDNFTKTLSPGEAAPGWDAKKFAPVMGSGNKFFFQFVHDGPEKHYLHVQSGTNNSFSVGVQKKIQFQDWPVLTWEWKVTRTPTGGDVRVKSKDDQGGAMCVVIDPSTFGFDSILCYIYENEGPKDTVLTSTKEKTAKYIILRTASQDKTGEWYTEKRNALADYQKAFGKPPGKPGIVGIQIDSNDTESTAEAFYRNIQLLKK